MKDKNKDSRLRENDKKEHTDERLELLFRHAGLSEKQAKLYRLLLITGEERPATLARKSGIKRANTYALLDDMNRRGIVTKFEKERITYFRPEAPDRLLHLIEAQQKNIQIAQELANDLIPSLSMQFKTAVNKPVLRYYEGKEGMAKVFEDIYGPKTGDNTVWGCVDIEKVHTEFPESLQKKLIPMRIKNDWLAKSIFTDNVAGRELHATDTKHKRVSCVADGNLYPLPAEIDVYDDKITMLCFEQGEFMGFIVENKAFAETLRSIFKLAFKYTQENCTHKSNS